MQSIAKVLLKCGLLSVYCHFWLVIYFQKRTKITGAFACC